MFAPNATSAATKEAIRNRWKEMFASPGFVITWQADHSEGRQVRRDGVGERHVRIDDERRER